LLLTIEPKSAPNFAVFSPDSKSVIVANDESGIDFFSLETRKNTNVLKLGMERARSCCFSSDGNLIAVGVGPEVHVVDIKTGKTVEILR
jgi:hypothetical protein